MMKWLNYSHKQQCRWSCLQTQYQQILLKLKSVEYLHRQQWHQELDRYDSNDTEKRSETHNIYKYRWDIHSVYSEVTESDYNNKHNKYNENNETKALNSEHIHR